MATTTPSQPAPSEARDWAQADQHGVAMHDIGWNGYMTMLRLRGEQSIPRMIYLDGTVWLMSPSYSHEFLAERLGAFVHEILIGLKIPYKRTAGTTIRRKSKRGGVEPDKSYYLANAARIQGKKELNLSHDPPPDLAVEAINTHAADAAVEVYRRLGVPEVWVCDGSALKLLILHPNGRYVPSENSLAFPFLAADEILDWVARPETDFDTDWDTAVRDWVRDVLAPRIHPAEGGA